MSVPHPGYGLPSSLPSDTAAPSHRHASGARPAASDDLEEHAASPSRNGGADPDPDPDSEVYPYTDSPDSEDRLGVSRCGGAAHRCAPGSPRQRPVRRAAAPAAPQGTSETDPLLIREPCDQHKNDDVHAWWDELRTIVSYTVPVFTYAPHLH